MAQIAIIKPTEVLASAPYTASTPAGDKLTGPVPGQPLILDISNGHGSAITVALVPPAQSLTLPQYGKVTKTGISVSVPAAGEYVACIPADVVQRYIDSLNEIAVSYTSGNAALVLRAFQPGA